jgi:glycolate oxidase FAD binding subunit
VFEGIQPGVEAQAAAAVQLLGQVGEAAVADPGATDAALGQLRARPFEQAELAVKLVHPPSELPGVLADLLSVPFEWGISAHAATGVIWAGAQAGDLDQATAAIGGLRERLAARGGSLVLVGGSPELKRAVDVWGPPGDAIGLMRRVKERFDPDRRLSPGRFVGGI